MGNEESAGAAAGSVEREVSSLSAPRTSLEYYELGNRCRREGRWHDAINNYIAAIELDPDSPALEAKRMLDDILGYYNKDMYNP